MTISVVSSQFGPVPARLTIPGAISVGRPQQGPVRTERVLPQSGLIRIRRPQPIVRPQPPLNAIPNPHTRTLNEEAKPVNEDSEEDIQEPFVPQILSAPISQPAPPQALFTNEPNFNIEEPPRFQPQERPAPQRASDRFVPNIPQQQQQQPQHQQQQHQHQQHQHQQQQQKPQTVNLLNSLKISTCN